MNKKTIARWEKHLAEQMKDLKIESFRGIPQKEGRIELFNNDDVKCTVCGKPTKTVLFIDKYNHGQTTNVCKECLKKAIEILEKEVN